MNWERNGDASIDLIVDEKRRIKFKIPSKGELERFALTLKTYDLANLSLHKALGSIEAGDQATWEGAFDRTCELILEIDLAGNRIAKHCIGVSEWAENPENAALLLEALEANELAKLATGFVNEARGLKAPLEPKKPAANPSG
jgi:hypothetical protein